MCAGSLSAARLTSCPDTVKSPVFTHTLKPAATRTWLAGDEHRILANLAFQYPRQQPGLNLQQAAIADPILKHRMRDQCIHPQLVGAEKASSSPRRQRHPRPRPHKVLGCNHARVDG